MYNEMMDVGHMPLKLLLFFYHQNKKYFKISLIGLLTYLQILSQNKPLNRLAGLARPDFCVG